MKNPYKPGTHCHFLWNTLSDGQWHNVLDIMASYGLTIRNMAIRSRIADVNRDHGHIIKARISKINGQGEYRLKTETLKNRVETALKREQGISAPKPEVERPKTKITHTPYPLQQEQLILI